MNSELFKGLENLLLNLLELLLSLAERFALTDNREPQDSGFGESLGFAGDTES